MTYKDGELRNAGHVFGELRRQAETRHGPLTDEALAERLGVSPGALRSYTTARTMPKPATVRALAELAGIRVTRVYAELGWLPGHEVPHVHQPDLLTQLETTKEAVSRLTETLDGIPSESTGRAAVLASAAVLDDAQAGPRFQVRLRALEAGGRCPVVTTVVAEFTPQDTARPRDLPELQARALAAGLRPAGSAGPTGADDPRPPATTSSRPNWKWSPPRRWSGPGTSAGRVGRGRRCGDPSPGTGRPICSCSTC